MSRIGNTIFYGEKDIYNFEVYTTDADGYFYDIGGIYIFSKRELDKDDKDIYTFLHIGESKDIKYGIMYHDKWKYLREQGVNCICVYREDDTELRLKMKKDIALMYSHIGIDVNEDV